MKRLLILLILIFFYSCKITTTINLESDKLKESDDVLIEKGRSDKKQSFHFEKNLKNKNERKKRLKKVENLSEKSLTMYRNKLLSKEKYNKFAREAKHVIQRVVYLVEDEEDETYSHDLILEYLDKSITELERILIKTK